MSEAFESEVDRVVVAVKRLPCVAWPGGYDEVGLCVLDAVWSPGSNYKAHVRPVIDRYRDWRPTADQDTAADLVAAIDAAGGPNRFAADVVRNRQRTSTKNGILKAAAVRTAAEVLATSGLLTNADVNGAGPEQLDAARARWCAVTGQGSGITFRYFLMLCGIDEVKPDRMVRRFLAEVLGRDPTSEEAHALVTAAAAALGCTATQADHRIWSYQSRLAASRRSRKR